MDARGTPASMEKISEVEFAKTTLSFLFERYDENQVTDHECRWKNVSEADTKTNSMRSSILVLDLYVQTMDFTLNMITENVFDG